MFYRVKYDPKGEGGVPVVNGIQSSLRWYMPFTNRDDNYYMPKGDYTAQTEKNFRKVMKDYFALDFEGNWQDVTRRLVVTNPTTKDFVERYAANMEELDLMPDCEEKFKSKEREADELQKALMYEMAKGALAIFKPGESQPRQIRCDRDPNVMVVTEPLADCFIGEVAKKYRTEFIPRPVPYAPKKPDDPGLFTEPEPVAPFEVKPISLKHPGECPKENRIKKRPEDLKRPADILKDTTRDKLVEDLQKQKFEEATKDLVKPEALSDKPVLEVEDPGDFDMNPPHEIEVPEKPDTYDVFEQMKAEADSINTRLDSKYFMISYYEPKPLGVPEPQRPQVDPPRMAIPPELIPDPEGAPKAEFVYDEPQLVQLKPEGLEAPVEPTLDLSDLEEPEYPELGEEPPEPGRLKRIFGFFSSNWRKQAADRDNWLKEKATLSQRREQYEKDFEEYQTRKINRTEQYDKKMAEYLPKAKEYAEKMSDAIRELAPDNDLLKMRYDGEHKAYEDGLAALGGKSYTDAQEALAGDPKNEELKKAYEAERNRAKGLLRQKKDAYEKACDKWEKDHPELAEIRAENKKRKDAYEEDHKRQRREEQLYEKIYEGCKTQEERDKLKTDLLNKYEYDLEYYNKLKLNREESLKIYNKNVEMCKKHAIEHGIDPEEALAANRDRVERQRKYDEAQEGLATFLQNHPEITRYENLKDQYEEEQEYKEIYESRLEEWKEEKAEYDKAKQIYDQKLEAYKDLKTANENYEKKINELKTQTLIDARREVDEKIFKNKEELANFDERDAVNKHEQEIWDREKKRVDENNKKMYEPGGLVYNWKEKVKAYENEVIRYNNDLVQYNKDVNSLPDRHREWEIRRDAHNAKVLDYEVKKQEYEKALEEIKAIKEQNRLEEGSLQYNDMKNPLYRDYLQGGLNNGYYPWKLYVEGSFKMNARQGVDLSYEAKSLKETSKAYQKAKAKAPKFPSAKEQREYNQRMIARNKEQAKMKEMGLEQVKNPFIS